MRTKYLHFTVKPGLPSDSSDHAGIISSAHILHKKHIRTFYSNGSIQPVGNNPEWRNYLGIFNQRNDS